MSSSITNRQREESFASTKSLQNETVKSPLHECETSYSDAEAGEAGKNKPKGNRHRSSSLTSIPSFMLSATMRSDSSVTRISAENEEIGERAHTSNLVIRSGRQRKKLAARSKGGEFQTNRNKRRVSFCCVGSEVDVHTFSDYLVTAGGLLFGWQFNLFNGGLHLFKAGQDISPPLKTLVNMDNLMYQIEQSEEVGGFKSFLRAAGKHSFQTPSSEEDRNRINNPCNLSSHGAQEVFVFDFGAAVFWGFSRHEEVNLLKTIRYFVSKGAVKKKEFRMDDMAFVTTPDVDTLSLSNDIIVLPENSVVKQRLSVSFAIAQSSVLALFEARVERKVENYKHIPKTLAAHGKLHLPDNRLAKMIGEVFVIRHEVNFHTEILDTPNFFWKEEKYEADYRMVMRYLEMNGRTTVLNKRIDMLRALLDVLQQQHDNSHGLAMEWIVIGLISMQVVLGLFAILTGKE